MNEEYIEEIDSIIEETKKFIELYPESCDSLKLALEQFKKHREELINGTT